MMEKIMKQGKNVSHVVELVNIIALKKVCAKVVYTFTLQKMIKIMSNLKSTGGYKRRIVELFKTISPDSECSTADILYTLQDIMDEFLAANSNEKMIYPISEDGLIKLRQCDMKRIGIAVNGTNAPYLVVEYLDDLSLLPMGKGQYFPLYENTYGTLKRMIIK